MHHLMQPHVVLYSQALGAVHSVICIIHKQRGNALKRANRVDKISLEEIRQEDCNNTL